MAMVICDHDLAEHLREERKRTGADRYDEVWDGVYVVMPLPNDEHQEIVGGLVSILHVVVGWPGLGDVRPGVNVSDRDDDWTQNYRCSDVVVFLQGTAAITRGAYWLGGPDFTIEVLSKDDRTREKLPFYARVGVRELLLIDRDPWALELYRLQEEQLRPAGRSTPESPELLAS
ncbi:MAG: Uma2 family endonuclease [Isosphaeraceae bacterium]|nr:Uma2 family endonuclease [Isosphaeraceae bacterium]